MENSNKQNQSTNNNYQEMYPNNPNPTDAPDWKNPLPPPKIQKPPKRFGVVSVAALICGITLVGVGILNIGPFKQFKKDFTRSFQQEMQKKLREQSATEAETLPKGAIRTEEKKFHIDINAARFGIYEKYKPDAPKPAGKHEISLAEGLDITDADGAVTAAYSYLCACDTKTYATLGTYSDLEALTYLITGEHIPNESLSEVAQGIEQTFTTMFKANGMDDCTIYAAPDAEAIFKEFYADKGKLYEEMHESFPEAKPFDGYYKIDSACYVKSNTSQNFIVMLHVNGTWKASVIMKIGMDALGVTNPYAAEAPTHAEQPTNVNGEMMTGEESARAAAAMFIRACKADDYATLSKITNLESLMFALTGTHYSEDQMAIATKQFAKNSTIFSKSGFEGDYDVENASELLPEYQEFYNDEGRVAETLKGIYAEQGVNYTGFRGQYDVDGAAYLITPMRKLVLLHINGAWVVEVVYADALDKKGSAV